MMASEIFEFDAAWAEKWTKTGVPFLSATTVHNKQSTAAKAKAKESDQSRH